MNLHEFQAKELLKRHGVLVPPGDPCQTIDEATRAIKALFDAGHDRVVVKSQIHAGGRGKGEFTSGFKGGVHLSSDTADAVAKAGAMLGNTLVTKQTGPTGRREPSYPV